ncbi:guanylate cyclase soluble subunit beta-2-like [Plakobranchus ocellatus]|uniref:Guanylate cyclase soluble subunit beta-2-like n=1 Tax=Plakobranchus ocellatus TaxID=259542 RepID=A0AAV3YP76_9GAST|nr:guanylate cyclase soluble subunit beta-2-like [Plakobranchus ocellatus]
MPLVIGIMFEMSASLFHSLSCLSPQYGQIHCVIRELVQMKFGNEAWDAILKKSQLDKHDSFLMFTRYDDSQTFSLVGAVSEALDVPVEAVLEIFGEFFFDYCLRHGYDKMLRTLGSDIKSFIQNLDSLHSLLALSYKGISAPSFRSVPGYLGHSISVSSTSDGLFSRQKKYS